MSIQEGATGQHDRQLQERLSPTTQRLIKRLGLTYVATDALTIRRRRYGRGFRYLAANGNPVATSDVQRLAALAVPPAYEDVCYAADRTAHIQAIGRLRYRYHAEWRRVREMRKARRLARLAESLTQIQSTISRHLGGREPTRSLALSAVIELVVRTAIRPGSEQYARLRGAATLLKSNVSVYGDTIKLHFRAKGAKLVDKEVHAPRLAAHRCTAATFGQAPVPVQ
jgi:DNA topoisomerase-1